MKYSQSQLTVMAKRVQQAKAEQDPRYLQFIWAVGLKVGLAPAQVMRMTEQMAKA